MDIIKKLIEINADHASKTIVHGHLQNAMIYSHEMQGPSNKYSLKGSIFIVQNESDL